MTDLERIRAKFAAEYGLSEDMLRNAERWTETTGDLEGVPENLLPGILGMRFGAIAIDTPRSERWSTPEDIDVIADLAYLPDGGYDTAAGACRGHLLDLYLPHDAVLRCGHTLPVYIDIHGGGFTYGYKELNRNFNVHLAETVPHLARCQSRPWIVATVRIPAQCASRSITHGPSAW